jgi:hypothetical protein
MGASIFQWVINAGLFYFDENLTFFCHIFFANIIICIPNTLPNIHKQPPLNLMSHTPNKNDKNDTQNENL